MRAAGGTSRYVPVLAAALLGALLLASPAAGADPETLVNANFRQQRDAQGVHYTPDSNGRVNSNYGWLYSAVNVNNSGLSSRQRLMKPDGSEYVLVGRVGQLEIRRRIKIDKQTGGVRVVERLRNPTAGALSARIILHTQLNYRYQTLLTTSGRPVSGALQRQEFGILGTLQGTTGVVLYHFGGPASRVKPLVVNQNNHQLQFHYTVQVPAGKVVSILHGGVILPRSVAITGRAAATLFKPYRARKYRADLPQAVRRTLVNVRRGSGGDDAAIPSIEQVTDVAPGALDQLAFAESTLLQGTATCSTLAVTSPHGTAEIPFERVAAVVGTRCARLAPRVHLRDGQKLMGTIRAEGLRFQMTSGMAIDLDVDKLDRLVMRDPSAHLATAGAERPRGPPAGPDIAYLVETFAGTRLRTQRQTEALSVATQWGEMQVPLEELKRLYLTGEEQPGYWVELTDRSRFRAFLRGTALEMTSGLFGSVRLLPHEVRRIVTLRRTPRRVEEDEDELALPHVVLAGGDLFVGRIDLDAVHFLAPGGVVPQPPAQIRHLHSELEGLEPEPGEARRFRADVWGGGHITGELRELVVPLQTTRGRLEVPVRDLVDVHVPTPVVPEVLRVRLRGLIGDLGHPDWSKREAASAALAELGDLARSALEQTLRETKDPEVERRVRRLLDKL